MDIWSLGVLLFLMVTGSLSFLGKSFVDLGLQIITTNFSILLMFPLIISMSSSNC